MFMSMSWTYRKTKLPGFLQQPVATEGIWLQFSIMLYSTQSTDSRRLLGGVRLLTASSRCCPQNAIYQRFINLYDIAAGPRQKKQKKQLAIVCLQSY